MTQAPLERSRIQGKYRIVCDSPLEKPRCEVELLQEQNAVPTLCHLLGSAAPHDPCTDNDNIEVITRNFHITPLSLFHWTDNFVSFK